MVTQASDTLELSAPSLATTRARRLPCNSWLSGACGRPPVAFQVDAKFDQLDAFALQHFSLQGTVRFGNEELAVVSDHAMPGYAFSWGRCRQCSPRGSRPTAQAQCLGQRPVGSNPAARNLFHQFVHGIPGHGTSSSARAATILAGLAIALTPHSRARCAMKVFHVGSAGRGNCRVRDSSPAAVFKPRGTRARLRSRPQSPKLRSRSTRRSACQ
jgi:hypothetical protein